MFSPIRSEESSIRFIGMYCSSCAKANRGPYRLVTNGARVWCESKDCKHVEDFGVKHVRKREVYA